jgi:hypothetical protein
LIPGQSGCGSVAPFFSGGITLLSSSWGASQDASYNAC